MSKGTGWQEGKWTDTLNRVERSKRWMGGLLLAIAAGIVACSRTELNPARATSSAAGAEQGGATPNGGGSAGKGGSSGSSGGIAASGSGGSSEAGSMSEGGAPDCDDFEPCTDDVA